MRTPLLLLAVVASLVPAAAAHADVRGCTGTITARSCTVALEPGDTGVRLVLDIDATSAIVAARVRCCALAGPDGQPLRDPVSGENLHEEVSSTCVVRGGHCETGVEQPLWPHVMTAICELGTLDPADVISGTWSCLPY